MTTLNHNQPLWILTWVLTFVYNSVHSSEYLNYILVTTFILLKEVTMANIMDK